MFRVALLLGLLPVFSVAQLTVTPRTNDRTNCRVKPDDFQPLITRDNPYFYRHTWNPTTKVEEARLDEHRAVSIEQTGCIRHHTKFIYTAAPAVCRPKDLGFYALELFNLFNRLNYADRTYWQRKAAFEQKIISILPGMGLDSQFDFQLADYTYICEFAYEESIGAIISIEEVRLPQRYAIKYPGIPSYEDDAHFEPLEPFRSIED